jgi:hypothetical protein
MQQPCNCMQVTSVSRYLLSRFGTPQAPAASFPVFLQASNLGWAFRQGNDETTADTDGTTAYQAMPAMESLTWNEVQ